MGLAGTILCTWHVFLLEQEGWMGLGRAKVWGCWRGMAGEGARDWRGGGGGGGGVRVKELSSEP